MVIRGVLAAGLIQIGVCTNLQESAVLHHDPNYPLRLGKNVTVGHKAMLHGCTIGDNTLIGMNATVLNGAKIGTNCIIGANTLIPLRKIIPDDSLVVGSPGNIIRRLTEEQVMGALQSIGRPYVENGKRFRKELVPISSPRSKL